MYGQDPNSSDSQYQRLVAEGYTEDQIRMILELGGLQGQQGQLDKQSAQADKLRDQDLPQGRQIGDQYFNAHPLEFLASAYTKRKGAQQGEEIFGQERALQEQQMQRRMEYLKGGVEPGMRFNAIPGQTYQGSPYEGPVA